MTTPSAPRLRLRTILLVACAVAALSCAACSGADPGPPVPPAASAPTASSPAVQAPRTPVASPEPTSADVPAGGGTAALRRCASAQLAVTLGPAEGGAGSVYRSLVFTNTAGHACELRGFPGVSYVAGDDGRQVGPAAGMVGQR